jgi:hypothetical protein
MRSGADRVQRWIPAFATADEIAGRVEVHGQTGGGEPASQEFAALHEQVGKGASRPRQVGPRAARQLFDVRPEPTGVDRRKCAVGRAVHASAIGLSRVGARH